MSDGRSELTEKKKNNKKKINIWIIVCAIILIYLFVYLSSLFASGDTVLYQVTAGSSASFSNTQYTGFIIRSESVFNAPSAGYVNFFVGDSTPVSVGDQAYVLDASGELSSKLEAAAKDQTILSDDNLKSLRNTIYDFDTSFNISDFYDAYYFKYSIQSQIMDMINSSVFADVNNGGLTDTYSIVTAEAAGIMLHSIDGYENVTINDIDSSTFKKSDYNKEIIKSNDLVQADDPVYKVITSEEWEIVIQLENADDFADLDEVTITFLSDGVTTEADFETLKLNGGNYAVISLDKYMVRYASERYVQIKIIPDSTTGLKIPKTSVDEEEFYLVPVDYKTQGGDSSSYGFMKQLFDSSGNSSVLFVTPDIVKTDDEYCYVSMDDFAEGDVLLHPETNAQYKLSTTDTLQGVYVSSNGEFTFKLVDIISESDGYYIVASNTSNGIRSYDQIRKFATNN